LERKQARDADYLVITVLTGEKGKRWEGRKRVP